MYTALTGTTPLKEYFENAIKAVDQRLLAMPRAELLDSEDQQLVNYFRDNIWALEPIEQDPNRDVTFITKDHTRKRTIEIPLVPRESNIWALKLRDSSWPMYLTSAPNYLFRKTDHILEVTVNTNQSAIDQALDFFKRSTDYLNTEIPAWTAEFTKRVAELIINRKGQRSREVKEDKQLDDHLSRLGIVLKKKPDAVEPVNVQIKRTVQMLRTLPTTKPTPGDQFINPTALLEVIRLIDQIGKNFEVAPVTYNKLEEEDLRNIIVATLNAVFESSVATGETFSRLGHSDIRLNVPAGDILIAECKIWQGQGEYRKAVTQLFRYLTHRHSVGLLITFVREQGIQGIMKRAITAITKHSSFHEGSYKERAYSYHISSHKHPTDPESELTIHHLFFHLFDKVP